MTLATVELPLGTILYQRENEAEYDRFAVRYSYLGPDVICQFHTFGVLQLSLEKNGEKVVLEGQETLEALAVQILDWIRLFGKQGKHAADM